jgi:hypothetical protein
VREIFVENGETSIISPQDIIGRLRVNPHYNNFQTLNEARATLIGQMIPHK